MGEIKGIAASSGKAAGKVFRVKQEKEAFTSRLAGDIQPEQQITRFQDACAVVKDRLVSLAQDNDIFAAHVEILEDLAERVVSAIEQQGLDAADAVQHTCDEVCALFADIDDEYLRARSDDIVDVCQQIIAVLAGKPANPFSDMPANSIVVADNLLPSDTIRIDLSKLTGIALKKGSVNSHLAILARNNAIPLILGIGDTLDSVQHGDMVVLDAEQGVLITEPGESLLSEIMQLQQDSDIADTDPAVTMDGVEIAVYANAGSLFDVERAISRGADGIGLLRTEFIFMQSTQFPDEDEQYRIYSECAKACQDKALTIRTLDIGADKQLPYYAMASEENPALGLRGIRFSLAVPDIFKVQLRAILRASVSGNIRLMFPMITSIEEYNSACIWMETCKKELKDEGKVFDENIRPGIMIETPASVLLADDLACEVPFFSIGTNDLTQYILAVDRENPYTDNACNSFHPAVIKSLSKIIEAGQKYGIDVSVCGELASDIEATELLLKLGIRALSVTSRTIPDIKEQIRQQTIN